MGPLTIFDCCCLSSLHPQVDRDLCYKLLQRKSAIVITFSKIVDVKNYPRGHFVS